MNAGGELAGLLVPVRARLTAAVVLQAIAATAAVVPYVAVARLGHELLGHGAIDRARVWTLAAIGAGALLARIALGSSAITITHFADADLQLHLRRRLAERLARVPLGWFDHHRSGEVTQALQEDVATMHHLVAHASLDLTTAAVTPVVAAAYLLSVDWRMALVSLAPVAVGVALYARMLSGYGANMTESVRAQSEVRSATVELVAGIAVVKAFARAHRAHHRYRAAAERYADAFEARVGTLLRLSAATDIVLSPVTGLAVVLAAGTGMVAAGWISAVDLLPFALLGVGLSAPLLTLAYGAEQLRQGRAAAGRVASLLAAPVLDEAEVPAALAGTSVRLDGVRFAYDDGPEVLRGIDLVLEPGTVTALVGPSGSGKSTLARLLPRFWDPTAGTVSIGGVDLRQVASGQLHRLVGVVFQDVQLLRATVRENIALARPGADLATVHDAARAAQIHERLLALPRGYDTVLGEQAELSGGEAQRVSIARALLADTPILVLDEATAFADPESEAAIQDALSALVAGRTLLVIAHRLQTIAGADRIVVLDDGEVVQHGTHERLLAHGDGLYARLWHAQERRAARPLRASR